ncbi:Cache recognition domain protein [uncultured virus]|nr:Cache recognition domain protein [uncultured virus]
MKKNFQKLSLKKQLLTAFLSISTIFLTLNFLLCILTLFLTNKYVINTLSDSLINQIDKHTDIIINEGSFLFESTMMKAENGLVKILAFANSDTYKNDYSMATVPSYFDFTNNYLAGPLEQDERQNKLVSFIHSSYYIPNSYPSNLTNLSNEIILTRDLSAHIDPFFKSTYINNRDFVNEYIGFENNGFFRSYPGKSTLDTNPNRTYDPRVRGWYNQAINNKDETIFASPYLDYNGKGWMITIAKTVRNIETNEIIGVAGADMLLTNLNKILGNIKFLESGKVSLLETNGQIVSDKNFNLNNNDTNILTYSNLNNPTISDEIWKEIVLTKIGEIKSYKYNIEGENYIIKVNHLNKFNSKYLIIISVKEEEILSSANEIIINTNKINLVMSVSLTISFIVFIIFIILLILYSTKKITYPLNVINKNINNMIKNIGKENIYDGMKKVPNGLGNEINELVANFNKMTQELNAQKNKTELITNPYYGGNYEGFVLPTHNRYPDNIPFYYVNPPSAPPM